MSLVTLLIIILIVVAISGLPQVGFHNWGYVPSGSIGLLLLILVVLLLLGRI